MKTRRNVKHKRSQSKRSKHKRSQSKRSQSKRSAKKAKHTKKRVRFATRKMRGGYVDIIKMKSYPSNFTFFEKRRQKNVFKKYTKEIDEICKEINGFIDYKYLSADKRQILLDEFNRKRDLFVDIINKVQLDLNNLEYKENDKKIIDLTNMQHHTENLLNTFMECYSNYTRVEVIKDSAGEVVRSLNPRSNSRSLKPVSPEYMRIDADSLVSNYSIFDKVPPPLPPVHSDDRTNRIAGIMRSARPAPVDVIVEEPPVEEPPKVEEPRRRAVVRGKKEEVPVLQEFTAAQAAIADLDKFLSIERRKMK